MGAGWGEGKAAIPTVKRASSGAIARRKTDVFDALWRKLETAWEASNQARGVVVDPGMCVSSLYLGNREVSRLARRPRRRCREGEEP